MTVSVPHDQSLLLLSNLGTSTQAYSRYRFQYIGTNGLNTAQVGQRKVKSTAADSPLIKRALFINSDLKRRYANTPGCVCGYTIYTSVACKHIVRVARYTCAQKANHKVINKDKTFTRFCSPRIHEPRVQEVTDVLVASRCNDCIRSNERWSPYSKDGGSLGSNSPSEEPATEKLAVRQELEPELNEIEIYGVNMAETKRDHRMDISFLLSP
ncbi:hypothetical protein F4811DRAFT_516254 [Daldinia bambusicola]|nr:hypothetical protein F4811DRAFT_516254 [Daldinia bambusicola]